MRWAAMVQPGTAAGIIRDKESLRGLDQEALRRGPSGRHRKFNAHLKVGAT